MLGTAIFGLVCNLIMVWVLHGGDGGHHHHPPGTSCPGHGHDHDHDHHHDHGHAHDHSHNDAKPNTKKVDKSGVYTELLEEGEHKHSHEHNEDKKPTKKKANDNINVRAAFIHIIGDIIQSIGVLIAAIIIKIEPTWKIVDPICTFAFAIIVAFTTVGVIKSCVRVLMETTPEDFDMDNFRKELLEVNNVKDIEDLHVWSLKHEKVAMTAHI